MKLDNDVSARIDMLRFLMIFGVILVHVAAPELGSFSSPVAAFLRDGIFRASVPVLTVISGYLMFKSGLDTRFSQLVRKKGVTLLIPFLVFNVGWLLIDYIGDLTLGVSLSVNSSLMTRERWLNGLFSYYTYPLNVPLHFVRELLVLTLLTPALGWLIRKFPVVGLILIGTIFISNLDGHLINRSDMPINFYLGGLMAVYKWDLTKLDAFALPALVVLVAVSVYTGLTQMTDILEFRLVAPFLVWPAASLITRTPAGIWLRSMSKYSFFLFVSHCPLIILLNRVNAMTGLPVAVEAFFWVAPIFITVTLVGTHKLLSKTMPKTFSFVLGSRIKPLSKDKIFVERRKVVTPVFVERRTSVLN